MLLYYVEGNKRKHVSPDLFFVRGIEKRLRDYYLLWQEGVSPQVVIEVSSSSTAIDDTKGKKVLYRDVLKVQEYFIFDAREEYLQPSFQSFRLVDGNYVAMPGEGRFHSEVLGLDLRREGWELRLFDPATGNKLQTRKERLAAAEHELAELRARYTERNGH
jgi:Uma2 family endonuclease